MVSEVAFSALKLVATIGVDNRAKPTTHLCQDVEDIGRLLIWPLSNVQLS